jgi:hypothetical protein
VIPGTGNPLEGMTYTNSGTLPQGGWDSQGIMPETPLGFVRTPRSMLFDVSPSDPAIFSGAVLLLFAVTVSASYIPAVRATRKNPFRALRRE